MLELILVGRQAQDILEILRAEGRLPWGNLAEGVFFAIYGEVVALCEAIPSALRAAPRTISTVALPLSRPLWGSVSGLVGQTMIRVRYVREHPKHLVASWIEFLALCAASERGGHRTDAGGIIVPPSACLGFRHAKGGRPVTMEWTPPTDMDAAALLERFIEVFSWAQVVPLPFSPQTCWDAAYRKDVAKAFAVERQRSSAMRRLLDDDSTLFGGLPTCDGARSLTFEVITDALFRPLAEQCDRARSKKTSASSAATRTDSSKRSGKRQTSKGRGKGATRDA
jgi:exonuclease V gamma subunit